MDRVRQYLSAQEAALQKYRELCQTADCGFEEEDAYVYSMDNWQETEQELNALEKLGLPGEFSGQLPLPFPVAGTVKFPRQAQLHPLKFVFIITEGLHIYEYTTVQELADTMASTNRGKIRAKKIIITIHFPLLSKHGSCFLKLYQYRFYVIALENAPDVGGIRVDESRVGSSFRSYGDLLPAGGSDHRTEKQGGGRRKLRAFARRHYPHAAEKFHQATQDCMSLDGIPHIGPYSASATDLYIATGFNKWRTTSFMVSVILLCDLVQDRENSYNEMFSPSWSILHRQLAANGVGAAVNLLASTSGHCPHIGYTLRWSVQEHIRDYPCHGSRFTEDRRLFDNPAARDLNPGVRE